jgi:hypothetical protein
MTAKQILGILGSAAAMLALLPCEIGAQVSNGAQAGDGMEPQCIEAKTQDGRWLLRNVCTHTIDIVFDVFPHIGGANVNYAVSPGHVVKTGPADHSWKAWACPSPRIALDRNSHQEPVYESKSVYCNGGASVAGSGA